MGSLGRAGRIAWRSVPRRRLPGLSPTSNHVTLLCVYREGNVAHVQPVVALAQERRWDVRLWALGKVDPALQNVTLGTGTGSRTQLLNRLAAGVPADRSLIICDDDITFPRGSLVEVAGTSEVFGLDLAQPALTWDSEISHPITIARPWLVARSTTFVEIGPVLYVAPKARSIVFPMDETSGMGWGLEIDWSRQVTAGQIRAGIVDAVPVRHIGRVGAAYDREQDQRMLGDRLAANGLSSLRQAARTRARYWCVPTSGGEVAGWSIADMSRDQVVDWLADRATEGNTAVAACLHVSALRPPKDEVVRVRDVVDLAYADGWSIVRLARLAGLRRVERATFTHLADEVIETTTRRLGRLPRLALVGGPPELARHAGEVLEERHHVVVAYTDHGYHETWEAVCEALHEARPDIVFVGMGYPQEIVWLGQYRHLLPPALHATCGGYFGYLAGQERIAPRIVQRVGLEWLWRLAQDPGRLWHRYLVGALDLARHAIRIALRPRVPLGHPSKPTHAGGPRA